MKISRAKTGFLEFRIKRLVGENKGEVIMLDSGRSTR